MQRIRSSIVIDAPPETVFEHADDWALIRSHLGFVRLKPVDDERARGTGAAFRVQVSFVSPLPMFWDATLAVVDHYYPERVELASTDGDPVSLAWTFGRVGERTLVEVRAHFSLPGGMIGHLAGNGLVPLAQRNLDAALVRLKRQVEAQP